MIRNGILMDEATENGGGGGGTSAGAGQAAAAGFDMNAFFSRFETMLDTKLGKNKAEGEGEIEAKNGDNEVKESDSPRWKKLEKDLIEERRKREDSEKRAEEKDRHSNVRGMLSDFTFANDAAREDAFKSFAGEIKRLGQSETLAGPENEAAKEYIRRRLEDDRSYLLKPKDVGGSGAQNGGSRGNGAPLDIANLKPGMSAEELQRYRTEIARIAVNAMRGQ